MRYAAAQRPDLVATLVAVGTDIDGVAAGNSAYDFALDTARQRGNKRAIRQLEAIGPPPHLEAKQFGTRVRWASNFGGVTTQRDLRQRWSAALLASLVRSSDYSTRGRAANRSWHHRHAGRPAARDGDPGPRAHLPRLDVPVVMVQGRLDQVAPGDAAQRYVSSWRHRARNSCGSRTRPTRPSSRSPRSSGNSSMRVRADQLANT